MEVVLRVATEQFRAIRFDEGEPYIDVPMPMGLVRRQPRKRRRIAQVGGDDSLRIAELVALDPSLRVEVLNLDGVVLETVWVCVRRLGEIELV